MIKNLSGSMPRPVSSTETRAAEQNANSTASGQVATAGTAELDRLETANPPGRHVASPPPPAAAAAAATGTPALPEPRLLRAGPVQLVSYGASQPAIDEAARTVAAVTQDPDIAAAMRREKVAVVIIPEGRKMTELPEFRSLRGQHTFDGRLWDDVRGVGGLRLPDGRLAVGVPEENLVHSPADQYQGDFSVTLHELAHVVQNQCLDRDQRRAIQRRFDQRSRDGDAFSDSYASRNAFEYFAQSTNVYFGRNDGQGIDDPAWLQSNDPDMHGLMSTLYPSADWPATPSFSVEPPASSMLNLLGANTDRAG